MTPADAVMTLIATKRHGVTHEFFGMGAVVGKAKDAVQSAADDLKAAFAGNMDTRMNRGMSDMSPERDMGRTEVSRDVGAGTAPPVHRAASAPDFAGLRTGDEIVESPGEVTRVAAPQTTAMPEETTTEEINRETNADQPSTSGVAPRTRGERER